MTTSHQPTIRKGDRLRATVGDGCIGLWVGDIVTATSDSYPPESNEYFNIVISGKTIGCPTAHFEKVADAVPPKSPTHYRFIVHTTTSNDKIVSDWQPFSDIEDLEDLEDFIDRLFSAHSLVMPTSGHRTAINARHILYVKLDVETFAPGVMER